MTLVNWKWAFLIFPFNMPWRYQIFIEECLNSYRDNLPENYGKTTTGECEKSTSCWRALLKNVFTWTSQRFSPRPSQKYDRARSTSSLFFLAQERRPYAIECTFPQNQRVIAVATEVNRTSNENQSRPFKEFIWGGRGRRENFSRDSPWKFG